MVQELLGVTVGDGGALGGPAGSKAGGGGKGDWLKGEAVVILWW